MQSPISTSPFTVLFYTLPLLAALATWWTGTVPPPPHPALPIFLLLCHLCIQSFWKRHRSSLLDGRYQVLEMLGSGGMSRVYLAEDKRTRKRVAVKVLQPPGEGHSPLLHLRECCAYQQLDHPGILRLVDYRLGGEHNYLVLEYCKGRSLRDIMQPDGLSWLEIYPWVEQLVAALAYAHRRGIIHRDIKPENILIDHQGKVLLIDFGLSCRTQGGELEGGTSAGTLGYMAPEQLLGQSVAASDQFALATVIVELLTGRGPLQGMTANQWLLRQANAQRTELALPATVPSEAVQLLQRMLDPLPELRMKNWEEWICFSASYFPHKTCTLSQTERLDSRNA